MNKWIIIFTFISFVLFSLLLRYRNIDHVMLSENWMLTKHSEAGVIIYSLNNSNYTCYFLAENIALDKKLNNVVLNNFDSVYYIFDLQDTVITEIDGDDSIYFDNNKRKVRDIVFYPTERLLNRW